MFKATFWIIIVGILTLPSAFSQDANQAPPSPLKAAQNSQDKPNFSSDTKLVENWINMSGQFNDRLLSTVYWSLGAVGVVFAGLIGFGWYVNYRVYERDKAAMLSELRGEIAREISELRTKLHANLDDRLSKTNEAALRAAKAPTEQLKQHIDSLRKEISRNNLELEAKFDEIEADSWKVRDIPINEIRVLTSALNKYLKIGDPYQTEHTITRIGNIIVNKKPWRGDWEPDLVLALSKLPEKYITLKERIMISISDLPSKKVY